MKAVLVDHDTPAHICLGEAPEPTPGSGEVLIRVEYFPMVDRYLRLRARDPKAAR